MTEQKKEHNSEKPIMVYSRRPRAPQQSQELNLELSPPDEAVREDIVMVNDLDMPIALWKGVRSCVNYCISNQLAYSKLSLQLKEFTTSIDQVEVPKDIQSALQDPKSKPVVLEEMRGLVENDTWAVMELTKNMKVVGNKWGFSIKYKSNGSIEK